MAKAIKVSSTDLEKEYKGISMSKNMLPIKFSAVFATSLFVFILLASDFSESLTIRKARADDWPQWRGPNRDGISTEKGLLKSWLDKLGRLTRLW